MARKMYVNRTMKSTRAIVLCMDVVDAEPLNKEVVLPAIFKDENAILKAARPLVENERIKAVSIVATNTEYAMYRMPIEQFLASAEKVEVK